MTDDKSKAESESESESPFLVAAFNRIDALAESATRHGYSKAIADMAKEIAKAFNEPRRRSLSLEEIYLILTRLGKE